MIALALALLAQGSRSRIYDMETVQTALAEDLNGDRSLDLVVQSGLDLHAYFQTHGGFPDKPDRSLRFGEDSFLWCLVPENGTQGPRSLLLMTRRGIERRSFDSKEAVDLVVHPTLFEGRVSADDPPLHFDFTAAVEKEGARDLLLFTRKGLLMMKKEGAEYVLRARPDIGIESGPLPSPLAHSPLVIATSIPPFALGDVNGDGRTDLVWSKDSRVTSVVQHEDGGFRPVGAPRLLSSRRHRPRRALSEFQIAPRFEDLNGDGLLDVQFPEALKGRVRLFYGVQGRPGFSDPEEREIPETWLVRLETVDLRGDGRRILALWVLPRFGLSDGIEAFVSRTVRLQLHLFDAGADGHPAPTARTSLAVQVPFTMRLTRETREFPVELLWEPYFQADWNGDGIKDLLMAQGKELRVHLGHPERLIEEEARVTIPMQPPTENSRTRIQARDLDGDGDADLLLVHSDPLASRARVELLLR